MPLPKRVISPVYLSRDTLPEHLQLSNDLEGVTNGTLANIIRQLSSLSRHAEDLFGELYMEAELLHSRSSNLQARIDRLAVKVTQLDSTVEEVSLQDIHLRKAFRSNIIFDQQVVSKQTIPNAMADTYHQCDKPPPLGKLNIYRDDGKDGLKFYTDPDYFFDLWRQEMLRDTERIQNDKGRKPHRIRNDGGSSGSGRHRKRVRQPHNTRERHREIAIKHGEYISSDNTIYQSTQQGIYLEDGTVLPDPSATSRPPRPNSIGVKNNYASCGNEDYTDARNSRSPQENPYRLSTNISSVSVSGSTPTKGRVNISSGTMGRESLPPPPPPPVDTYGEKRPYSGVAPSYISSVIVNSAPSNTPPPPPLPSHIVRESRESSVENDLPLPPPPPLPDLAPPQSTEMGVPPPPPLPPPLPSGEVRENAHVPNGDITKSASVSPPKGSPGRGIDETTPQPSSPPNVTQHAKQASRVPNIPAPAVDARSDLLKAIRDGISLRKVEKGQQREVEKNRMEGLHDVASILARRVAIEFSDSESGSDSGSGSEWDDETSA